MTYDVSTDADGTVLIKIAGDLDTKTVPGLETGLAPTMTGRPKRLVVDASDLEFADSSAIALLVRWANVAQHVEIRDPQPRLRRLILRMGLAHRLRIDPLPGTAAREPD